MHNCYTTDPSSTPESCMYIRLQNVRKLSFSFTDVAQNRGLSTSDVFSLGEIDIWVGSWVECAGGKA